MTAAPTPWTALLAPRPVALAILLAAGATIAAALVFEHVFGYAPCALCLRQRWPYYIGLPVAALAAALAGPRAGAGRGLLAVVGLVFLASVGLGLHHVGVEEGWWLGPADCAPAAAGPAPASMQDFLATLETVRVVSCTEAAWRFLGLSMAAWNAIVSAGLAGLALVGAVAPASGRRAPRRGT